MDNVKLFLLSIGIVGSIVMGYYILKKPVRTTDFYVAKNKDLNPVLHKLLNVFGKDILAFNPEAIEKASKQNSYTVLFRDSNNPWKVTVKEFVILRWVCAFIGSLIGLVIGGLFALLSEVILFIPFLMLVATVVGYFIPQAIYLEYAKKRRLAFKKDFPEALDLLIMYIDGNKILREGFGEVANYLPDGIIKDEFKTIDSDIKSGQTNTQALSSFANRAPTEGIKAFAKALENANRLSISEHDILEARAVASRKELELEIEERVIKLPTKVMLILSPASGFALIAMALSPSLSIIFKALM